MENQQGQRTHPPSSTEFSKLLSGDIGLLCTHIAYLVFRHPVRIDDRVNYRQFYIRRPVCRSGCDET